ncbi:MAG TPA: DUF2341 domain-containing protein, partial [Cyclobacteriaceae bacterium]|nr:DUF2341 domain-containing protein [Cyclobacteriaceae bacterium]
MKKLRQPVPAGTKCGQKKLPHFNVMFWLAMFIFLICNVAYGQVPGYSYRVKITIDGSQVCGASNLINFPILIQHTAPFLRPTPNGLISNVNGYDIVFTAADGSTLLSHQIDHYTYNATDGTYAAWVKIPSLAPGADTDIYMYYGNSSVVTNTSTTATWDANYRTVYHLQSSSFSDATANSINSTNNGTTTFAASKIGEGRDFGGNDYIQTNSNDLKTANNFTVSAWFKADVTSIGHLLWEGISSENGWGDGGAVNTTTGQEMNLSVGYCCPPPSGNAQGGYLSAYLGHTEEQVEANGLTAEMVFTDVTNWHYVTATYSNLNTTPQVSLYLDGVLIDTDNGSTASNAVARNLWDTNLRIGRPGANQRQFNGQMDEVRISNIARSADWQCTEYNNQNNPGGGLTLTNDAPDLSSIEGTTLNFTEGDPATSITSAITITDENDGFLSSATVQITGNYISTEDVLAFTNAFGITGSWNSGTGTLTLTGTATLANYQSALRSVTYQNTSANNPSTLTRTVSFKVNDGVSDSNIVTRNISVAGTNDAPVLAAIEGAALAYSESQAATAITATTTVSDVDNANIASATIQITGNYLGSEDVLAFTNAFGITGSWNVGTGLLTLTGSTTLANYQTALRSVTYQNTNNNNPSTLTRTISF